MQGHELDKAHLIKERGNVAWHLAEAAIALDIPLEAFFREIWTSCASVFPTGLTSGLR